MTRPFHHARRHCVTRRFIFTATASILSFTFAAGCIVVRQAPSETGEAEEPASPDHSHVLGSDAGSADASTNELTDGASPTTESGIPKPASGLVIKSGTFELSDPGATLRRDKKGNIGITLPGDPPPEPTFTGTSSSYSFIDGETFTMVTLRFNMGRPGDYVGVGDYRCAKELPVGTASLSISTGDVAAAVEPGVLESCVVHVSSVSSSGGVRVVGNIAAPLIDGGVPKVFAAFDLPY